MVFSSLVFLFIFLPIVIITYFSVPIKGKNFILLLASLFFYAWGEPKYIFLMIISIVMNYIFGLLINGMQSNLLWKKWCLSFAVIGNLLILGFYKYSAFLIDNINLIFNLHITMEPLALPIGISFFTFQAMSYIIDVYRKDTMVQKNIFHLALYISLFPQLVAGPIVRYNTIADQIKRRVHNVDLFSKGVRQFIIGLAKKVLIANQLGEIADYIFALEASNISVSTAWIGIIAYSLQIYFDFSGYSDMAIGLGKMFGFTFLINFNYPYIARSITEFWRRWHISLSSWFRDYVYIPLGGNRKGPWKTYRNLLIVWTITGFWHGASWTFLAWGLYYGIIISIERLGFSNIIKNAWKPVQHAYMILVVMIGWVFFRADNFTYSFDYLKTMSGLNGAVFIDQTALLHLHDSSLLFIVAIIFSMPVLPAFIKWMTVLEEKENLTYSISIIRYGLSPLIYFTLLLFITMFLVNSTYNPFIYFRF